MRQVVGFLNHYLPQGWQTYFNARRAGFHAGIEYRCPFCNDPPPTIKEVGSHSRRVRWMMAHVALCPKKNHKPHKPEHR
jgi:hypothetical protein